ncbi:MAG TPA: peptidoglycan DD-metalloendopeptidase family protein [Alphaproteobacteria bacterium]|nr:peptidoglycan DD-metalloendopeptidase family protein [Alphaproteobacteria bacterium]
MTSYLAAYRGPNRPSHRSLLVFSVLAALPLVATTIASIKLTTALTSPSAFRSSVMLSGTNVPSVALRPTLGGTADLTTERAAITSNTQDNVDPIGDFVASLAAQPASVDYKIARGDTLLGIFDKLNVDSDDAQAALGALKSAKLSAKIHLRPTQHMLVDLGGGPTEDGPRPLLSASVQLDPEQRVEIKRSAEGSYTATIEREELTAHNYLARGIITSSLASAAEDQGVSSRLVNKFTKIYAYDVDFQRDLHPDDTFEIYYTQYANAEGDVDPTRGEILFTRLSFGGKVKTYYRFASADGKTTDYYDQTGKSARTFLMRTPVDGARISSGYGMRFHPILGYTRMHKGVDFAATPGTHVYAAGAGVVERASLFGTYGNYVKIRHDNGYETAYAHLKGYGPGIRPGVRVAQGQVVGYVGTTGESTGPHLHYEVLQKGAQVNPMSVKATGIKLAGAELTRFKEQVGRIELALKSNPSNQVAAADEITGSRTH